MNAQLARVLEEEFPVLLEGNPGYNAEEAQAAQAARAAARAAANAEGDMHRQTAIRRARVIRVQTRIGRFPLSDNLLALMMLCMSNMKEQQRETVMQTLYNRNIELGELTVVGLQDIFLNLSSEVLY